MTINLSDRLWVPRELVTPDHIQRFQYNVTDPYTREPYLVDTTAVTLDQVGFPRGDLPKVMQTFGHLGVTDNRIVAPHGYPLRFTGELRAEQPRLIREWITAGYGQIMAPPRTGKCVAAGTLIQTDHGLIPIDQLWERTTRVGGLSTAFHCDVWHDMGYAKVTTVTTTRGYQVTGTHEHPVLVLEPDLQVKWKPLADIMPGDCLAVRGACQMWPTEEPLLPRPTKQHHNENVYHTPSRMTTELATVLGYIVSEGATTHHPAQITNKDPDLLNVFEQAFSQTFRTSVKRHIDKRKLITTGRASRFIGRFLYAIGLCSGGSSAQRVPWSVCRATKESVRAFLRAYFDGDGWQSKGVVSTGSASRPLLSDIQLLLLNFGIFSTLSTKRKRTPKGLHRYYSRLTISGNNVTLFEQQIGFNLRRKQHNKTHKKGSDSTIPYCDRALRAFVQRHCRPGGWYGDPPRRLKLGNKVSRSKYTGITAHYLADIADEVGKIDDELGRRFHFLAAHPMVRWVPVARVQRHRRRRPVYDLTVPLAQSYQANGVIVHNTVVMTALTAKLRQRTILLCHLEDLCHQFIDAVRKFTNIEELEEQHGIRLAGVLQEWTDFFPIVTASTYQCFAVSATGRRVLHEHRDDFGLVLVDEVHRCFGPGTLVSGRAIETLRQGDTIEAYDGHNVVNATVLTTMTSVVTKILTIKFESGRELTVTPNHPLWDGTHYRRADSFEPGGLLYGQTTSAAGQKKRGIFAIDRVASIEVHQQGGDGRFEQMCPNGVVYNLTVEPCNNYFANGILVHNCKTELFTEVVTTLTAAYRCGVTATPERKDRLHCIVEDVMGPVVTVAQGEQLPIEWTWELTDHEVKDFANWSVMVNRLVRLKNRTKRIAQKVVEDVRAGHFVLVTTERLQHIDDLSDAIQTIDPDITVGRLTGKTKNRERFREEAKQGKFRVVVAMNKIVELGYNIPRWSCFHNTIPMTDPHNWYQRVSRIRTPFEPAFPGDHWDKPTPIARVWADRGHPAIYAYRNIVKKKMDSLGFVCLTPENHIRRGKRRGLVSFELEGDTDG